MIPVALRLPAQQKRVVLVHGALLPVVPALPPVIQTSQDFQHPNILLAADQNNVTLF
ncbi:hypothetical protein Rcae01_05690 [Novipirellula caenicola]|uniref:Uncharacterized protein n=1 Tax=Novipirellula caenicola TaxID=1536901 RepID=A0ABP9VYJ2_9BACT